MLLFSLLMACGEQESTESVPPTTIEATIHLLSVPSNANQSGVSVYSEFEEEETQTEESGKAIVSIVQKEEYNIHATTDSTMKHIYQGEAGEENFELVGYLVDRSTTQLVYSSLGINLDTTKGIVVAAIDYPDLSPVYGASADLSASEEAFVFGAAMPQEGNTLLEGGSSFVFFPNVSSGQAEINITPPADVQCRSYPGGALDETFTIDVYADTVSIAVFQCQ